MRYLCTPRRFHFGRSRGGSVRALVQSGILATILANEASAKGRDGAEIRHTLAAASERRQSSPVMVRSGGFFDCGSCIASPSALGPGFAHVVFDKGRAVNSQPGSEIIPRGSRAHLVAKGASFGAKGKATDR